MRTPQTITITIPAPPPAPSPAQLLTPPTRRDERAGAPEARPDAWRLGRPGLVVDGGPLAGAEGWEAGTGEGAGKVRGKRSAAAELTGSSVGERSFGPW